MSYPLQDDQRIVTRPSPAGHIPGAGPGGMQYGEPTPAPPMQLGYVYPSTGPANMKSLDGITDFTPEKKDVRFRIYDDIFYGVQEIPALTMLRYAAKSGTLLDSGSTGEEEIAALNELIHLLLIPESAELLMQRMQDNSENAIGLETYMKILPWLMEQYGMRPTPPSSGSPDGSPSPDDGTSSTANSVVEVSTSSPYPSTDA